MCVFRSSLSGSYKDSRDHRVSAGAARGHNGRPGSTAVYVQRAFAGAAKGRIGRPGFSSQFVSLDETITQYISTGFLFSLFTEKMYLFCEWRAVTYNWFYSVKGVRRVNTLFLILSFWVEYFFTMTFWGPKMIKVPRDGKIFWEVLKSKRFLEFENYSVLKGKKSSGLRCRNFFSVLR